MLLLDKLKVFWQNFCRVLKVIWRLSFFVAPVAALIFGFWGFMEDKCYFWSFDNIVQSIISTLQLFVLNVSSEKIEGILLGLAAFLAPYTTINAVLTAFFTSNFSHWLVESLSLTFKRADYVFIGGGDTAVGIAMRLHKQAVNQNKLKIIGMDTQKDCQLANATRMHRMKGFIHLGSAFEAKELACLRLYKARNIIVSVGTDLENIDIARHIIKIIQNYILNKKIRLYVHVRDHHLVRAREILFPELDESRIRLELVSIDRMAARAIFNDYPPQLYKQQKTPHILIVGCSELAIFLLIHAVQHCVYDETEALKITWLGIGVEEKLKELRKKFIALNETNTDEALNILLPLVEINTVDCDEDDICPHKYKAAQLNQAFNIAYVACTTDDHTYSAALRITSLREISKNKQSMPIIACFQKSQSSLSELIDSKKQSGNSESLPLTNNAIAAELFGVNIFNLIFNTSEKFIGEYRDFRAMLVNGIYFDLHLIKDENGETIGEVSDKEFIEKSRAQWEETKKGAYRWSSRLSADHIKVKLGILQKMNITTEELANNKGSIEKLARLEHCRFLAERLIEGWLPIEIKLVNHGISGLNKDDQKNNLHLNHTLVPFDNLSNKKDKIDQKNIDIQIVLAITRIQRCEQFLENEIKHTKSDLFSQNIKS